MNRPPEFILDAAREKRSRLLAERNEADRKIAEIDAFLRAIENAALDPREDPSFRKGPTP